MFRFFLLHGESTVGILLIGRLGVRSTNSVNTLSKEHSWAADQRNEKWYALLSTVFVVGRHTMCDQLIVIQLLEKTTLHNERIQWKRINIKRTLEATVECKQIKTNSEERKGFFPAYTQKSRTIAANFFEQRSYFNTKQFYGIFSFLCNGFK